MENHLAEVLGSDHPLLVKTISDFERASGHTGIDTRLIADLTEKAHQVMREIGLDPANTETIELYNALNSLAKDDAALSSLLRDTDYVLLRTTDGAISFNAQDVIENSHHELAFDERSLGHAQRHLRGEIIKRYAAHDRTNDEMIHELAKEAGLKHDMDEHYPQTTMQSTNDGSTPSILAIGDIFTDAFIKLSEDVARVETDEDGGKRLSIPFGSKPPYEAVDIVRAVGPSPNAAVSFARLGLNASLLAWMGDDQTGTEAVDYLKSENIDTSLTQLQPGIPSNYYYVLRLGAERTILVKNEAYSYDWVAPESAPDWVYLSLIDEKSWQLHEDLLTYLNEHPETKLAFQPGTFHFKWGAEKLSALYGRSHIIVMNREEAVDVTGRSYDSIRDLAEGLHELGPKIVVITDGPNGSYASYDGKVVTIPNFPDPAAPVDRTGAGDAFASTIVAGLALGESMDTALTWAPINSMNVVQQLGAQTGLLSKTDIETHLANAPSDYRVTEIE